jgi:hypothetical protein
VKYKLVVRTEDANLAADPYGFTSDDSCADVMRVFCTQEGQPYSEPFVSISISVDVPRVTRGNSSEGFRNEMAFGEYEIVLVQDVIDELQVISAGDYQNIICKLAALKMSGQAFHDEMRQKICDLSTLQGQQRRDKIDEFVARAKTYNRLGYAEARIFRVLTTGDKEPE